MKQNPASNPLDRFVAVMEIFIMESDPAMSALNAMSQQLERDLGDLLRYFGEDPLNTKVEDFFGTISSFAIALQVSECSLSLCLFADQYWRLWASESR